ncbi:cytochrome P450 [Actinomycetospora cinnamomea]|uniref:Erythromycin 12 hydroxylase n=1 Tax=Actinomycetospora cinnamomea TaxID=663609 RepID=A0A2U1F0Z9_9PSEU|nr:cytochrome P450 [Actinomycetospora cinnamomea]PVZ05846.1 erythromycin 12 hydroxylase [Actinomycetospora cinnamomea]
MTTHRSTLLDRDLPPDIADLPAVLEWLAALRAQAPVWRDRYGMHHVTRHDDVQLVLRDHATFSSDFSAVMPGSETMTKGMLTRLDPPEHRALRHLVSASFTPRRVAGLEPRIRELTRRMLDEAGEAFDLVDTLAFPLPVTVIAEMLGLPAADHPRFRAWAEGLFSMQVDDPKEAVNDPRVRDAMGEVTTYLGDWCRARREDPTDDLVSALVTTEVDGRRLDDEEAANFSMLLLFAGHITTTLLLGNAIRVIDGNPGAWASLRADPSTIPATIEEVLRLRPPFPLTARATTRDVDISGITVPERSMVMPWLLSANHDPDAHPDPERFDPSRPGIGGGSQLAFGHGIHFCLGAPLARLEARVALEEMTARYAALSVGEGEQQPYTSRVLGTRHLPVVTT